MLYHRVSDIQRAACGRLRTLLTYVAYPNGQLFSDMINSVSIFKPREQILGGLTKLRTMAISFTPSVCPHGTTRPPVDGFSWNLTFEYFSKIFKENSGLINIEEEYKFLITSRSVLRMKNVSDKICIENQNTHFALKNFLPKIVSFVG
jgi:hypothetical protein